MFPILKIYQILLAISFLLPPVALAQTEASLRAKIERETIDYLMEEYVLVYTYSSDKMLSHALKKCVLGTLNLDSEKDYPHYLFAALDEKGNVATVQFLKNGKKKSKKPKVYFCEKNFSL